MKKNILKLSFLIIFLSLLIGCSKLADKLVGDWVNVKNKRESIKISKDSDDIILSDEGVNFRGILRENAYLFNTGFGEAKLLYDKEKDQISITLTKETTTYRRDGNSNDINKDLEEKCHKSCAKDYPGDTSCVTDCIGLPID